MNMEPYWKPINLANLYFCADKKVTPGPRTHLPRSGRGPVKEILNKLYYQFGSWSEISKRTGIHDSALAAWGRGAQYPRMESMEIINRLVQELAEEECKKVQK